MNFDRTRSFLTAVSLLLILFAAADAQSRRVEPTPTPPIDDDTPERVETEEIKLNVLAFDEEGRFVTDVTDTDLVITENDRLHQPTSVRRVPANVLIVLDTGGEMRQVKSLEQTQNTALAVVEALKPGDSIAVLQYADRAEIIAEWTTDKQQAADAIGGARFGRRSAFIEAIELARDFMARNPAGNRHLVLITDGTDSSGDRRAKEEAIRSLLSTDMSVHVISYARMEAADIEPRTSRISNSPPPKAMPDEIAAQLPNGVRDVATTPKAKTVNVDRAHLKKMRDRKADLERSEAQLDELAENTNGTSIIPETHEEMIEKAALVARMIDSNYVVTYVPKVPLSEGPRERNIEVTSKRDGLIVQAKRKLVVDR